MASTECYSRSLSGATVGLSADDDQDQVLATQWRAGDIAAVEAALDNFSARFVRKLFTIYRPLLAFDEAEDIFMAGIARAWKRRAAFDPAKGPLGAWLWLNVKQAAATEIRAPWCQERSHEQSQPPDKLIVFVQPCCADEATASEGTVPAVATVVQRAMQALSETERTILWSDACSPDGRVPSGILAEELGIPKSTVRSHRARGKSKLKCALLYTWLPTAASGGGVRPAAIMIGILKRIHNTAAGLHFLQRPARNLI